MRQQTPLEARTLRTHIHRVKVFLLTVSLGGILALVMFGVLTNWDTSAMNIHGWVALALGTLFSLALGGGLMALVFYSARKGYDDRIEIDKPDQE